MSNASTALEQVLDDVELARHLGAAEDRRERSRGGAEQHSEMLQLGGHQESRPRVPHVGNHADGRRVGAVRRPERVVRVEVRELRQGRRERRVVPFLRGVEAQVLEQDDAARPGLVDGLPGRVPHAVGPRSGPARRAAPRSRSATGPRLSSGRGRPPGRPRCEASTSVAPRSSAWRRVGRAARMRVSSPTAPSAIGTLKSTRIRDAPAGQVEGSADRSLGHTGQRRRGSG